MILQQKLCLKSGQVTILSVIAEISVLSLTSNYFGHEDSRTVEQVGHEQTPSLEVFKTWLGKDLNSLVWPQSWPCLKTKTGVETSWSPSQPELSCYPNALYSAFWDMCFFSVAKSLGVMTFSCWQTNCNFVLFPLLSPTFLLGIKRTRQSFTQFTTFYLSYHQQFMTYLNMEFYKFLNRIKWRWLTATVED